MKNRIFLYLLFVTCVSQAQIHLANPSFEDVPAPSSLPKYWITCTSGSTPDILPGPWGVNKNAADGGSFIGLIIRENGSQECIGQRLENPLKANECYHFSMSLARSADYVGFNLPVSVRLWGSKSPCEKDQLLVETKAIKHLDWVTYDFVIYPKTAIHFILIEVCKAPGVTKAYRGNVLIDALSDFTPCKRASTNSPRSNVKKGLQLPLIFSEDFGSTL